MPLTADDFKDFAPDDASKDRLSASDFQAQEPFKEKALDAFSSVVHAPADLGKLIAGASIESLISPKQSVVDALQHTRALAQNRILPLMKEAAILGFKPATDLSKAIGMGDPTEPLKNTKIPTYTPQHPDSPVGQLTTMAESYLPISKTFEGASTLAKAIPEAGNVFSKVAKKALEKIAAPTAASVATVPITGQDPTEAALTGPMFDIAASTIGAAGRRIGGKTLAERAGVTATPEQIEERMNILSKKLPGVDLPAGDIFDSPKMQAQYQFSKGLWGSGANKIYRDDLRKQLLSDYNKAGIDKLEPKSGESVPKMFLDELSDRYKSELDKTDNAYTRLGDLSDKFDVNLDRSKLNPYLEQQLSKYKDIGSKDPDALKLYQPTISKLQTYLKKGKSGNYAINTFSDVNKILPVLSDGIHNLYKEGDRVNTKNLLDLKERLLDTLEESSQETPELNQALIDARTQRAKQGQMETFGPGGKKTPFYKNYRQNPDVPNATLSSDYIKPSIGAKDNTPLTEHIAQYVSKATLQAHIAKELAGKTFNQKLKFLNNFTPKQRELIFDKDTANAISNLIDVNNAVPGAISKGFDPETGQTGAKMNQFFDAVQKTLNLSPHAGLFGALYMHNPYMMAAGVGVPAAIGQIIQRSLRSPFYGKMLLKSAKGEPIVPEKISAPAKKTASVAKELARIQALQGGQ